MKAKYRTEPYKEEVLGQWLCSNKICVKTIQIGTASVLENEALPSELASKQHQF
jgi:hypothetical protein